MIFATTLCFSFVWGQRSTEIEVALYDVEHLYDTINRPRNRQFTTSDNIWDGDRYRTKIENVAQVIDSLDSPIIALIGVESEDVVRDLIIASQMEYCYLYRTLNYFDDLDCALLYYGDYLLVNSVETSNYIFTIKGEIDSLPVELNITRRGSKLRNFDPETPEGLRIVMGDFSRQDLKRLNMHDPLQTIARYGVGDTYAESGWYFKNRVGVVLESSMECRIDSWIYDAKWLLANALQRPLPTFLFGRYVGGYSSHLPIRVRIDVDRPL